MDNAIGNDANESSMKPKTGSSLLTKNKQSYPTGQDKKRNALLHSMNKRSSSCDSNSNSIRSEAPSSTAWTSNPNSDKENTIPVRVPNQSDPSSSSNIISNVGTESVSASSFPKQYRHIDKSESRAAEDTCEMRSDDLHGIDSKGNESTAKFIRGLMTQRLKEQPVQPPVEPPVDREKRESVTSMARRRMLNLDSSFIEYAPNEKFVPFSELPPQKTTIESGFTLRMKYLQEERPAKPARKLTREEEEQKEALRLYQAEKLRKIELDTQNKQHQIVKDSLCKLEENIRLQLEKSQPNITENRSENAQDTMAQSSRSSNVQGPCNKRPLTFKAVQSHSSDGRRRRKSNKCSAERAKRRKEDDSKHKKLQASRSSEDSSGPCVGGNGPHELNTSSLPPSTAAATTSHTSSSKHSLPSGDKARRPEQGGGSADQPLDDQKSLETLWSLLAVVDAYPSSERGAAALALLCAEAAVLDNTVFAELMRGRTLVLTDAGRMVLGAARQQEEPILPMPLRRVLQEQSQDHQEQPSQSEPNAADVSYQRKRRKRRHDEDDDDNTHCDELNQPTRKSSNTHVHSEAYNTSDNNNVPSACHFEDSSLFNPVAESTLNYSSTNASNSSLSNLFTCCCGSSSSSAIKDSNGSRTYCDNCNLSTINNSSSSSSSRTSCTGGNTYTRPPDSSYRSQPFINTTSLTNPLNKSSSSGSSCDSQAPRLVIDEATAAKGRFRQEEGGCGPDFSYRSQPSINTTSLTNPLNKTSSSGSSCDSQAPRLVIDEATAAKGRCKQEEGGCGSTNVAVDESVAAIDEDVHAQEEPLDREQNNQLTPEEFAAINGADGNGPIMMQISSP